MSEIKVNTSDLRSGSQRLDDTAMELGKTQSQISNLPSQVRNSYDGQLRQALDRIIGGDYQTSVRLQSRAHELSAELLGRSHAFEAANQASFSSMSNMCRQFPDPSSRTLPGSVLLTKAEQTKATLLFGIAGLVGASAITTIPKPSFLTKYSVESVDKTIDILGEKDLMSYAGFREIGRHLNTLVGNKKAGFVGFMDKTGHGLRNNKLLTRGAGWGLGVVSDLAVAGKDGQINQEEMHQALLSETIETGMTVGMDVLVTSLAPAIPIVGWAYTGYKLGMFLGHASVGVMEGIGMHEQAEAFEKGLDQFDFMENISDALSEKILDFVANPPRMNTPHIIQA